MWGRRALLGVTCRWRHRIAAVLSTSRRPSDEDGPLTNDRPSSVRASGKSFVPSRPGLRPSCATVPLASPAMEHWGACPPQLPITYFFLPHFGSIKVLSRSLVSNVFRILRIPQLLKSVCFSFCWKKWNGYIGFFGNTAYIWPTPVLCDFARVICVISMSFCVSLLAPNPGDATARRYDECSVC